MELRNKLISIAALACTVALGAGMACMTASAEGDIPEVAITRYAVRVNGKTDDKGNDTSGLRFWTETVSGEADYDEAYTIVSAEGIEGDKKVLAEVWRPENNGWNTVVMGIDVANYTTAITATSYVVKDGVTYTSNTFTSTLLEAANEAAKTESNAANKAVLNKYILDAAYALEGSATLEGTYTLTGVVSKVDTAFDTQWNNVTVTIVVDGNTEQTIKCYRMKGAGADLIGVGDTITVSGSLTNYVSNETSTIEFAANCTLDSYQLTAENQAKAELAALTVDNEDVTDATKTINLPTTPIYEGTTITWAVIAGNDNAHIENNVLSFTLPETGYVEVKVQATVKVGTVTKSGDPITINVVASGSEAPDNAEVVWVAGDQGYKDAYDLNNKTVALDAQISMISTKGTNPNNGGKYYTSDSTYRLYEDNILTFNAVDGYIIKSVEFTLGEGTLGNNTSVNAQSISFTMSGRTRIKAIKVVYQSAGEMTWEQKQAAIEEKLAAVTFENPYTDDATVTVPAEVVGVAITWTVTAGGDVASYAEGKVTITQPEVGASDVAVTITATYEGQTEAKTYNFTVNAKEATADTWTLVTNISDLKENDEIIIVASGYNYAISTTQNKNNRGQAAITKSETTISSMGDDVQVLTLVKGTTDGTFALYTGAGYLYAASKSSNNLKTETKLSANSSWKIAISADGTASIVAQGANTRNVLQYNQSSSLFSCYSSASQKAICIYKKS